MSANKQFIAPLPIKTPDDDGADLDSMGQSLNTLALDIGTERKSFLDWLTDEIGADPRSLPGKTKLATYDSHSTGELTQQLSKSAKKLKVDPRGRSFRDRFNQEYSVSIEKLQALNRDRAGLDAEADHLVYDLYGITDADRQLVDKGY